MGRFLGLGHGTGTYNLNTHTPIASAAVGVSGSYDLLATGSFVAGQRVFIANMRGSGYGTFEDNYVESYVPGTITLRLPLERNYDTGGAACAQVIVVPEAGDFTGSFTVPAWDGVIGGLAIFAAANQFMGTVNGNAKGFRGGVGPTTVSQVGTQGEGTAAAGGTRVYPNVPANNRNGNGGGGGDSGFDGDDNTNRAGSPGGGGHASDGSNGVAASPPAVNQLDSPGGQGGSSSGFAVLVTLISMGGAGGGGASGNPSASWASNKGQGGNGGAIIIVYCRKLTGATLTSNGGNGTNGARDGASGGAGGAGGYIWVVAVEVDNTNTLTANPGVGGIEGGFPLGLKGGDGAYGIIRIQACRSTATSSPSPSAEIGGHSFCSSILQMV